MEASKKDRARLAPRVPRQEKGAASMKTAGVWSLPCVRRVWRNLGCSFHARMNLRSRASWPDAKRLESRGVSTTTTTTTKTTRRRFSCARCAPTTKRDGGLRGAPRRPRWRRGELPCGAAPLRALSGPSRWCESCYLSRGGGGCSFCKASLYAPDPSKLGKRRYMYPTMVKITVLV